MKAGLNKAGLRSFHMLRTAVLSIFFILLFPPQVSSANTIHYVCLEETLYNGAIVKTEFHIYPVPNEYRYGEFRRERVEGSATRKDFVSIVTSLQNQAIANLVSEKGLKTIESRRTLVNLTYEDFASVKFEGFVMLPVDMISHERDEKGTFSAKFEMLFTPMALPSQFDFLLFRRKLEDFLSGAASLFKH